MDNVTTVFVFPKEDTGPEPEIDFRKPNAWPGPVDPETLEDPIAKLNCPIWGTAGAIGPYYTNTDPGMGSIYGTEPEESVSLESNPPAGGQAKEEREPSFTSSDKDRRQKSPST